MIHKGVALGLLVVLFAFSAIAQADSNPVKEEETTKKSDHVLAGGEPEYSEDQFGRRCCGWGPGRRYCVRWCRNAEEVAIPEVAQEEVGVPQYSEDQFGRRCCGWGPGRRYCVRWCRNAEEEETPEALVEVAKEGGPEYSEDQFGRRCCGWGPGRRYCVRWCRNAEEVVAFEAYEEESRGGTRYSVDQRRRCCVGTRIGTCIRWC